MRKSIVMAIFMAVAASAAINADEPTLKITPSGRMLIDGAIYATPDKEDFKDGLAIPDIRLGAKATYGSWNAKIDVGFSSNKVGLKDVTLQYNFVPGVSFLRMGSFIHQYGLQSATSSSMKPSFEEPLSNAVFNASRQIGVMYEYSGDKFLATASAHVEPNATFQSPDQTNQQGYGLLSRLVYRPAHSGGDVVQVGISGGFLTPQTAGADKPHNAFSFAGNFPTRVDKVAAVDASLTDAMNQFKFTPELLLAKGPVALEAQYFFNRVNMRGGLHNFTGQGAYAALRGLLLGDSSYAYAMADGGLATPKAGTLEFVALYNYTSLSDAAAQCRLDDGTVVDGIFGGRVNTLSATFNYYINKYMIVRLNYAYTHRWDASQMQRTSLNVFQARVQILF